MIIRKFLETLSRNQLLKLKEILESKIDGDIDKLLFEINREFTNRDNAIYINRGTITRDETVH